MLNDAPTERTILLVEDNPDDAFLTQRALRKIPTVGRIDLCHDGHEAILHLSRALVEKSVVRPDLVLTDLNMPRKDGLDVLSWIRAQRQYQGVPTVILTSSDKPEDIQRAKRLGVRQYLIKEPSCRQVVEFVENLFSPP